jgi:hypothetical protein
LHTTLTSEGNLPTGPATIRYTFSPGEKTTTDEVLFANDVQIAKSTVELLSTHSYTFEGA